MTDIDPDPDDIVVDVDADPDENINDENPEDAGPDVDYYNTEDPVPVPEQRSLHLFAAVAPRTYPILEQILDCFPDRKHVYVTSTTGGTHAKNSYHYRGEAIDVGSGSQSYKDELAEWLAPHHAHITELIHSEAGDKDGWYVKNGKRVGHGYYGKTTTLAHVNHVHFAIASVSEANALLAAVRTQAKVPAYVYPKTKPNFPGVLQQGSAGDDVRTLQRRLNIRGYEPKLREDGHFGTGTATNVKVFQRFARLPQTGAMDLKTFNALWDLKIT